MRHLKKNLKKHIMRGLAVVLSVVTFLTSWDYSMAAEAIRQEIASYRAMSISENAFEYALFPEVLLMHLISMQEF